MATDHKLFIYDFHENSSPNVQSTPVTWEDVIMTPLMHFLTTEIYHHHTKSASKPLQLLCRRTLNYKALEQAIRLYLFSKKCRYHWYQPQSSLLHQIARPVYSFESLTASEYLDPVTVSAPQGFGQRSDSSKHRRFQLLWTPTFIAGPKPLFSVRAPNLRNTPVLTGPFCTAVATLHPVNIDIVDPLPVLPHCLCLQTYINRFTRSAVDTLTEDITAGIVPRAFVTSLMSRFSCPSGLQPIVTTNLHLRSSRYGHALLVFVAFLNSCGLTQCL